MLAAMLFSVVVCLMALSAAFAFKPLPIRSRKISSMRKLSDNDSPSDMEADFGVTTSSVGQSANEMLDAMGGVDAKPMIKEFFATDESCSSLSRSEINEYVLELERMNPTTNPVDSPLLNGVWQVVSSGSVIGSPGMLVYQIAKAIPGGRLEVADLELRITRTQPRVTATSSLKVGTLKLDVSVVTELEPVLGSPVRMTEKYVEGKIGSLDLPLSSLPTSLSRDLIVTYLDEDLMIARDQFGSPDILRRKLYDAYQPSSLSGPSVASDADGAPAV